MFFKSKKKIFNSHLVLLGFLLFFGYDLNAQVLATGETGGKDSKAVFFTANGLFPEGLRLFNTYGQYVYGATNNLDLMFTYGNISALGRTQHYGGVGWNMNFLKRDKAFVDISFFNVVTVPFNKTGEASTILMTPAVVVSRPVGKATLYGGLSSIVPVGKVKDKLFTPPETFFSVPMGFSAKLSENWIVCVEFDAGTNLKSTGIGFLKIF